MLIRAFERDICIPERVCSSCEVGEYIVICTSVALTKTVKMPLSIEMNPFLPKERMVLLMFDLCSDL